MTTYTPNLLAAERAARRSARDHDMLASWLLLDTYADGRHAPPDVAAATEHARAAQADRREAMALATVHIGWADR